MFVQTLFTIAHYHISSKVNYHINRQSLSVPTRTVPLTTPTHTAVTDLPTEAGGGSSGRVLHWLNVEDIELLELTIVTQGGEGVLQYTLLDTSATEGERRVN